MIGQEQRAPACAGFEQATTTSVVALRWALGLFAVVIVVQAALGFAGALGAATPVLALLLVGGGGWAWRWGRRDRPARPHTLVDPAARSGAEGGNAGATGAAAAPWTASDAAGVSALAVAVAGRAWAGLHRTHFLYDVLSYHLHLPAAWRAAGRLAIVPTPFGDPAPAYAPGNAELIYHLGLVAAGNATLAHAGQVPFALLAMLAIHATARELGAPRAAGFGAALAFLLIPEVWQQTTTAMADLALASFFLATVPFLLRLERRRSWPDVVALGAALGLLLGTKYVSTVLAVPLLSWTLVAVARDRPGAPRGPVIAALVSLIIACGGFWHLRNAIVTGNPLFPATLRWGAVTVAPGLYGQSAIRTSEYHWPVTDLGALWDMFVETGWCWLAALAVGLFVMRHARWPPIIATVVLLFWFVVPYQQSRFLFGVWGLGAIVLAAAVARRPRVGLAALLLATAGAILEFPSPDRGAVAIAAVVGAALGARLIARSPALTVAVPATAPGRHSWVRHRAAVAIAAGTLGVASAVAWARARPRGPAYAIGDHHDDGWRWMDTHARGRRVAYTGSNLPLPLWGPTFENDVRYVNVSRGSDAAPHRFLDVPSPATPTAEPAPERQLPVAASWLANIDAFNIDLLFIAALYPGVARTIAHDDDGFPIERRWADARPGRFALAFSSPGIRIYDVRRARPDP